MFNKLHTISVLVAAALLPATAALAGVTRDLPYPDASKQLSALEVVEQNYFVNRFFAFDQYGIGKVGKDVTVLVIKTKGKRPTTITVSRFVNNEYDDDPNVRNKDFAYFHSGKLKATGMLITDYDDDSKSQSYTVWLPALRKVRRFAQPAHDDAWGGTDFTFGDVVLRKPRHETHELLGKETFDDCLGYVKLEKKDRNKWMKKVPNEGACEHKGKQVYKIKSTHNNKKWWYDYRIQSIDTTTFADYRTDYFKGGELIKRIDRDWNDVGHKDPRGQSWGYWYGITYATGHQTWAYIPENVVQYGKGMKPASQWTEMALRKLKR